MIKNKKISKKKNAYRFLANQMQFAVLVQAIFFCTEIAFRAILIRNQVLSQKEGLIMGKLIFSANLLKYTWLERNDIKIAT
jgi:hypothetical protein